MTGVPESMRGPRSTSAQRLVRKLEDALGETILEAINDASVVEIMLNPDRQLFIERLGQGIQPAGTLDGSAAETIIGIVAHALQTEADHNRPILSGELPIGAHRFEGILPPVAPAPIFSIRKRASMLIPLSAYVKDGSMTEEQLESIRNAVESRMNIIIVGGTGSGKTTLGNAILAEVVTATPEHRIVVLEDTVEIQCSARNTLALRTSDTVDMARLLKSTMRLRPDRIIVGEVRDGAALTMLKSWNTGHPGGLCTLHANDGRSALTRLEQLVAEVSQAPMREVIGEAVDFIIAIERTGAGRRRISETLLVESYRNGGYQIETCSSRKEHLNVA